MYWTQLEINGTTPLLRAHTMNILPCNKILLFGGYDQKVCFNHLYILDPDTNYCSVAKTKGHIPDPCRAHSATVVANKMYIFGGVYYINTGGDGSAYFNTLYSLCTDTYTWEKLDISGLSPGPRRAHTSWVYNGNIYVYAGGDGIRALDDIYMLNLSRPDNMHWELVETSGKCPSPRGYHTSNLVGSKVIVFGGSDGHECFSDIYSLDLPTKAWSLIKPSLKIPPIISYLDAGRVLSLYFWRTRRQQVQ